MKSNEWTNPPANAECFSASDFRRYTKKISKLVHGADCDGPTIFNCPRCAREHPDPEHGIGGECTSCDLKWVVYGNALYIWE